MASLAGEKKTSVLYSSYLSIKKYTSFASYPIVVVWMNYITSNYFICVLYRYQFYSHLVSTRMLPLRRMIRWTQHSRTRLNLPPNDPEVMFAAGFNFNKVINCATDTANVLISHVPALRAGTPPPPMAAQAAAKALQCGYPVLPDPDGVLRWFEHYAEALSSGRFAVEALYDEVPNSRGICLFPRAPPLGAAAVTRGIHVSAAPLFIAELSNITEDEADGDIQYFFAYR